MALNYTFWQALFWALMMLMYHRLQTWQIVFTSGHWIHSFDQEISRWTAWGSPETTSIWATESAIQGACHELRSIFILCIPSLFLLIHQSFIQSVNFISYHLTSLCQWKHWKYHYCIHYNIQNWNSYIQSWLKKLSVHTCIQIVDISLTLYNELE